MHMMAEANSDQTCDSTPTTSCMPSFCVQRGLYINGRLAKDAAVSWWYVQSTNIALDFRLGPYFAFEHDA